MRTRASFIVSIGVGLAVHLLSASPAWAQYGSRMLAQPATGEVYRVEIFGGLWNPVPEITVSSAHLGIPGTDIDFVDDLGIVQKRLREFRLVLRPARKHKFRVQYVPISYQNTAVLERAVVFNGVRFDPDVPVDAAFRWNTWRFGYEYDFIYRDRWFIGFIAEAKYTDIEVSLDSSIATEFSAARAPLPAIGGVGRVYLARNVAVTFEFTGFKLPESINADHYGTYLDFDVYATLNFDDSVGFQFGYRSIDLVYQLDDDAGDLELQGMYFGGLLRF